MSAVSYFDLCSILLVSFHYKCLSGMWARFQAKGNGEITDFTVSQNTFSRFTDLWAFQQPVEMGILRMSVRVSSGWILPGPGGYKTSCWIEAPSFFLHRRASTIWPPRQRCWREEGSLSRHAQAESERRDDTFHCWLQDSTRARNTHAVPSAGCLTRLLLVGD